MKAMCQLITISRRVTFESKKEKLVFDWKTSNGSNLFRCDSKRDEKPRSLEVLFSWREKINYFSWGNFYSWLRLCVLVVVVVGGGPSQIPPHIEDQWQEHVDLSGLLLASRQCQSKKTLSGATKTTRCTWDEFEQIDLSYTKQSHCFYIWCVCFQSALTVDDL